MDLQYLHQNIEALRFSGATISDEDFTVLENSLYVLQNENHFKNIYLLGKICGVENDYMIAFGYEKDVLLDRVYYYSTNCLDWGLLPRASTYAKDMFPLCTDPFQGDPAMRSIILTDDIGPDKQELRELIEEDRLAACVTAIMEEAAIIPRGSFYHRPDDVITLNYLFEGLSSEEACQLSSFQHYRPAQHKWNTNLLTRKDYDWSLDFLDTIDCDIPLCRTWTLHQENGGGTAILSSLYWPGMTFYHRLGTQAYGFFYCGNGRKNLDIPFMFENLD